MTPGEKIIKLCESRGWCQADLADRLGVARSTVNNWWNGRNLPDLPYGLKISRMLGVTLDYLADETQTEPIPSEIPAEERAILALYRALKLPQEEAIRRLATDPKTISLPGPSPDSQGRRVSNDKGDRGVV